MEDWIKQEQLAHKFVKKVKDTNTEEIVGSVSTNLDGSMSFFLLTGELREFSPGQFSVFLHRNEYVMVPISFTKNEVC